MTSLRFVPGSWKNLRLPLKERARNMFPSHQERPPQPREAAAAAAAAALESPNVLGPSRGRNRGRLRPTGAAPKTKGETGRRAGRRGNLVHPVRLCPSSPTCAPGSLMSSPCRAGSPIPSPRTGSDARRASRPLMENPSPCAQTTQSPQEAFCSPPLSWSRSAHGITPARPPPRRRRPAAAPPHTRRNGKAPARPRTRRRKRKRGRKAEKDGAPPASRTQRGGASASHRSAAGRRLSGGGAPPETRRP